MAVTPETIKFILEKCYYPVCLEDIATTAQIVDGQWYNPKWGSDTLQHIIDELLRRN